MSDNSPTTSIIRSILSGIRWLVGAVLVWLIVAIVFLFARPPLYEGTAVFQISASSPDADTGLYTVAEKLRRYSIHKSVLDKFGGFPTVEAFQKATAIRVIPRTELINLTVTTHDPDSARDLVRLLFEEFRSREQALEAESVALTKRGLNAPRVTLIDPIYSRGPVNPSIPLVIAAALACGVFCGLILIWLRRQQSAT